MSARYASKCASVVSVPGGVSYSDATDFAVSLVSRRAPMRSSRVIATDDLSKPI